MDIDCKIDTKGQAIGLLMTYRCNLDCKYCYINRKQDKSMALSTAQSILKPYLLDGNSGWLDVIFVGAETLMAMDVIMPLVEWFENGDWSRNVRFFGSTNGTLLNGGMKSWLRAHKSTLILGLSYDGLPKTQKLNRGSDAVDVDFFLDTWPKQQIQMTINSESVPYMADGIIYLLEEGAVVHPNVAFENTDWTDADVLEYGRQLDKLISYYLENPKKPIISQFKHNLKEYADNIGSSVSQPQVCGAGNGYKVFDVDGKSYPCHMLSPLVLKGDKLRRIQEGILSTATFAYNECQDCPFRTACPTCLACNYLYRDGFEVRDSTHCRIMKIEVFAFIKMEIERLSKKAVLTPNDATEIDAIHKLHQYYNMTL